MWHDQNKRKWRSSPPHPTFCFLYKKRHRTGCLGSLVLPMAMIWDDPRCPSPCPCFFPIALSISDIPPSEVHSCILITITTVIRGQGPHISHFIGSWEGGLLLTQIWRLILGRAPPDQKSQLVMVKPRWPPRFFRIQDLLSLLGQPLVTWGPPGCDFCL